LGIKALKGGAILPEQIADVAAVSLVDQRRIHMP
jgi:hypothetical protein